MAAVTLSVEIELAWGFHDLGTYDVLSDDRSAETAALKRFLDACDRHDLPVSFDIVGHLLIPECDGHDSPHQGEWFDADPRTNVDADPLFYAPDLLEAIRSTKVDHEICTHSFSHVLCEEVSSEVVRWELERCHQLYRSNDLPAPQVFVPPRHQRPPVDVVRELDIDAVRVGHWDYRPSSNPLIDYARRLLWAFERSPPAIDPVVEDGIVLIQCHERPTLTSPLLASGQCPPNPIFRSLPVRTRQQFHESYLVNGLDTAIRNDSLVCYWSHLSNFSNEDQWKPIGGFLAELGRAKEEDAVEVRTLSEVQCHVSTGNS